MPLNSGDRLGRYEITSQIGEGGMGQVYLAYDPSLQRKVAIKILDNEFADNEERLARFVREARSASALNHPNILTIFEITRENNINFIVSEFVEGRDLKSRIKIGKAGLAEALEIAIQSASALAAAHDAGIVHRDIKPANVMVREDGIVKIVDFGIAKLTPRHFDPEIHGEAPTISKIGTAPGMMIGTPRYMSPEQARGKPVDNRSDIFSFGLVLFELFTGSRAFDGESSVDVLSSILKDEAPSIRDIEPALPKQLERIISKALRKDVDHRYQDVRDLLIDLEDLRDELKLLRKTGRGDKTTPMSVHHTDAETAEVTGSLTAGIVKTRRFTLLHAIGFAAAVLVIAGGYIWYDSYSHPPEVFSEERKISEVASWSNAPGELLTNARFSPDGKLIAFTSTKSGTKDIWVTQAVSGEPIPITKDGNSNTDPVWSPDGSQIAYLSDNGAIASQQGSRMGLWRVSALGGDPKAVVPLPDGSTRLKRWSGDRIVYESGGELFAVGVTDGKVSRITDFKSKNSNIAWADVSDDGKTISYAVKNGEKWDLSVADADGSDATVRLSSDVRISDVVWLAASDTYFFSRDVNGIEQVFGLAPEAEEPIQLTDSPTSSVVSDASPDASSVLFSSVREESNLWRVSDSGENESPFARSVSAEFWPAVSSDGSRVAFQSVRNLDRGDKLMSCSLIVKSASGGDERSEGVSVTPDGALPAWSPDGSNLAFMRIEDQKYSLFVVNASGGSERRIGTDLLPVAYSISPYNRVQTAEFTWLPDGSGVAYAYKSGEDSLIKFAPFEAGTAKDLTKTLENESQYCPIPSRDGKTLAYYSQTRKRTAAGKTMRSIWTVDLATSESRRILETNELVRLIGWTADNTKLILARASRYTSVPPETILLALDPVSGSTSEINSLQNAYYYNIFLSNDGSRIAYASRAGGADNLWIVPSGGGTPVRLTDNNDPETYFSAIAWSQDSLFFGKQTRFSLLSKITDLKK